MVKKKTWDAFIDVVDTWDNAKYYIKDAFKPSDVLKNDEDIKEVILTWGRDKDDDFFEGRVKEILAPF